MVKQYAPNMRAKAKRFMQESITNGQMDRQSKSYQVYYLPALSVILRVVGASNLWGGGSSKPPGKFFPAKTWKLIKKSRIPWYICMKKNTQKVTLVNSLRPPPHKKLPYTTLLYRNVTLNQSCCMHFIQPTVANNKTWFNSIQLTLIFGMVVDLELG